MKKNRTYTHIWFDILNQLSHISNIWSPVINIKFLGHYFKSNLFLCDEMDLTKTDFGISQRHKYHHVTAVISVRNRLFWRNLWAFITGLEDNIPPTKYPNKYTTTAPRPVVVYCQSDGWLGVPDKQGLHCVVLTAHHMGERARSLSPVEVHTHGSHIQS